MSAGSGPVPASPPAFPEGTALIDTVWRFMDASGASFIGHFLENGRFEGSGDARLWKWELTDHGISIVFDNAMGTRIVRDGRFIDPKWLNGSALSSDGAKWDWVANRIEDPQPVK
jgi:hypothetical protein